MSVGAFPADSSFPRCTSLTVQQGLGLAPPAQADSPDFSDFDQLLLQAE